MLDDKKLFRNYVPIKKKENMDILEGGFFEVSEKELKELNVLTHGGKRKGAGKKKKFSEATTTISFRVPISKTEMIKKMVTKKLLCFIK